MRWAELYSAIGAERSLARLVRRSRARGFLSRRPVPESVRGKGAPGLTRREQEVASLAAAGYTIVEIAKDLSISVGTVRKHLEHIRGKLGIKRKTDLVRITREP
jgi:DNA-binding CsgD family transcriptional regulator